MPPQTQEACLIPHRKWGQYHRQTGWPKLLAVPSQVSQHLLENNTDKTFFWGFRRGHAQDKEDWMAEIGRRQERGLGIYSLCSKLQAGSIALQMTATAYSLHNRHLKSTCLTWAPLPSCSRFPPLRALVSLRPPLVHGPKHSPACSRSGSSHKDPNSTQTKTLNMGGVV